jgi:glycosyltransferase involved in cell wall biosynthesis
MSKYFIAIPTYYEGTSFVDIINGLKEAKKSTNLDIEFIGCDKPLKNTLHTDLLDDSLYIDGQIDLIRKIKKIKNLQKILFIDFFNPGFDLIRYYHQQLNLKCKYGALLHGGTFLSKDLYYFNWLKKLEFSWAELYDLIYVPSYFCKKILPLNLKNKSAVFPWGMDSFKKMVTQNKKYDVVFPHRINSDKGIDDLIYIAWNLPRVNFIITIPQSVSFLKQNKYYKKLSNAKNIKIIDSCSTIDHIKILGQSKIILSCAKQENFGYSVMKATLSDNIPILPNSLCYPEFFNKKYLYSSKKDCIKKIEFFLKNYNIEIGSSLLEKTRININKFSFEKIIDDFFNKK